MNADYEMIRNIDMAKKGLSGSKEKRYCLDDRDDSGKCNTECKIDFCMA